MSTNGICVNCRMKGKPLRKINPMFYDMKVVREGQRDGKIGQVRWLQKIYVCEISNTFFQSRLWEAGRTV